MYILFIVQLKYFYIELWKKNIYFNVYPQSALVKCKYICKYYYICISYHDFNVIESVTINIELDSNHDKLKD